MICGICPDQGLEVYGHSKYRYAANEGYSATVENREITKKESQ